MKYTLCLSLLFLLLLSCVDEKDYNLSSVDVNPSVSLPLVHGSVSIKDFLSSKDSSYIKTDKDGLLSLVYYKDLFNQQIRNLFLIPDTNTASSITLSGATFPQVPKDLRVDSVTTTVDLNLTPAQLNEISFKSGQLVFSSSLNPASNLNYELIISLPDFISKTTNLPLVIQGRGPNTIQLSNYIVKLTKNKFSLKTVFVLKKSSGSVTISANTKANFLVSLTGMNFSYIKGFFGTQSVDIPSSSLDIGAYGNSLNKANLSIAQPSVNFVISNDYGVPVLLNFITVEVRKSNAAPLTLSINPVNPVSLLAPSTLGLSAITTLAVTNTNQVINYAPTQFFYQATATINKGLTTGNNFLADTSKLRVKLNVNIPLYGKVSGITFGDTTTINLSDVNQSQIEEASLKIKITNEIPLDGSVQFYLADSKYVFLDSLLSSTQTSFIKGSSVTAAGDLQTAVVSDQTLTIAKDKLSKIFTAKYIILKAVMSTSKDASGNSVDVKFKSQYKMTIDAGLSAKLNFNIKI